MENEFNDLQALLRLKKYEAPPTEYFEDFLFEFHRRQRAEMLRRPLWRLALDRLEGALPNFSPARTAYAGSFAVATVVAVAVSGQILTTRPAGARAPVALTAPGHPVGLAQTPTFRPLDLHNSRSTVRLPEVNFDQPRQYTASARSARPRYVLDTQPVSYVQRSSF